MTWFPREDAAIPLDRLAEALHSGSLSLDFLDSPAYARYAEHASETFRAVSDRTGVPLDLFTAIREATGSPEPSPDDALREDEMAAAEFAALSTPLAEQAVLGLYHAQQARARTANFIGAFETLMANAGIHSRLERPQAVCFLDITGYSRLTQEQGDEAAADLAAAMARLVQRRSGRHGGKPIKWLGDGVMFHFQDPGPAVRAALEMVSDLSAAGLPPAHVGLHAGPVLYQHGDYFGQTVNLSARIADYARPGEVLVSRAVAESAHEDDIVFRHVGPVELKGMSTPTQLMRAEVA
ncbi:MAG: adenylate/guanylate cyclase domain-containing protein [Dermatophilaceae bacterium]